MTSPTSFSASDSALGYLYQVRLALLSSLERLGQDQTFALYLETLDDVVFESTGSAFELLQLKHHCQRAANLTDASPDLWKTLRVVIAPQAPSITAVLARIRAEARLVFKWANYAMHVAALQSDKTREDKRYTNGRQPESSDGPVGTTHARRANSIGSSRFANAARSWYLRVRIACSLVVVSQHGADTGGSALDAGLVAVSITASVFGIPACTHYIVWRPCSRAPAGRFVD